jgi:hypothetical protein
MHDRKMTTNTTQMKWLSLRMIRRGFILPLTLLICTILLIISSGITTILAKQVYFSKLSRQSQLAYLSADNGSMCAVLIDDKYYDPVTGSGIFPWDRSQQPLTYMNGVIDSVNLTRQSRNDTNIFLTDITCATSQIFSSDPNTSAFTTTDWDHTNSLGVHEDGYSSKFNMKMDLGDGSYRCAEVTVNKTQHYRQIISRGFANCNFNASIIIERAVINTTENF